MKLKLFDGDGIIHPDRAKMINFSFIVAIAFVLIGLLLRAIELLFDVEILNNLENL